MTPRHLEMTTQGCRFLPLWRRDDLGLPAATAADAAASEVCVRWWLLWVVWVVWVVGGEEVR